jgi:hypothetical protein
LPTFFLRSYCDTFRLGAHPLVRTALFPTDWDHTLLALYFVIRLTVLLQTAVTEPSSELHVGGGRSVVGIECD